MHRTSIFEDDRSAGSVGGASAPVSSLRPRRGDPVILVFSQRPAARCAADESDLDEGVSSLGSLSVSLVASFRRPTMKLLPSPREANDGSA